MRSTRRPCWWASRGLAAAVIAALDPTSDIAAGMLLVAACPAGGITNYFTYLARANTAPSVTLTAVATVLAVVTMPALLVAGFALFPDVGAEIEVPVSQVIVQLFLMMLLPIGALMMLLPIGAGMMFRRRRRDLANRIEPRLRRLSLAAILGLVIWILYDQRRRLASELDQVLLVCFLFTALAMLAGLAVGWVSRLTTEDRLSLVCEFSARNLGIATVIAVSVLGRLEFLLFASVLFVTSAILVLTIVAFFRALHHRA